MIKVKIHPKWRGRGGEAGRSQQTDTIYSKLYDSVMGTLSPQDGLLLMR